jgi:hypothetical protein
MIDPYDPEGFRAAGHALIDQLADHVAEPAAALFRSSTSRRRV